MLSHKLFVSIMIWVVGWFLLYFCVLESLAAFPWAWNALRHVIPGLPSVCPWYTVSRTSWHIERAWWPFQFVFLFGLVVLAIHIFQGGVVQLGSFAIAKVRKISRRGTP